MAQGDWQTPATDSFRSRGGQRKDEMGLDQQARLWNTPTSRDWKDDGLTDTTATNSLLGRQVQRTEIHGSESSPSAPTSRRRLNPKFVCWLMGYPQGLISFEPWEMEPYLSRWRMRLGYLLGD